MPAPQPVDRFQPSFLRFPIQNDRTGFKPVALPVILVVPGRRDTNGRVMAGSGVSNVRYFIVDAPDPAKVAGPFNTGLLVPQLDQFIIRVTDLQLVDVLIDPSGQIFRNSSGDIKSASDAVEGDVFEYSLVRGGTRSTIPFYPDADYYDLSLFAIDVEDLPRPNRYFFVWQTDYKRRIERDPVLSSTQGRFCINQSDTATSQFRILINHPGEVHNEMFRRTPPFIFDDNGNFSLTDNPVLEFYRPFADALQDVFDEQFFLNGINHIDKIPAQLIPYLSFLIGWDLPNYPGVTDTVRRSILRHAVRLQQLKGSRRAIIELFEIFGFSIDIINLWHSVQGDRFIAPEETLPEVIQGQQITTTNVCQIDPLAIDYTTPGFGDLEIPFIFRATDDFTVSAWLVQDGPTRDALLEIVEELNTDPAALEAGCQRNINGSLIPQEIFDRLPDDDPTVVAFSEVFVDFASGNGESRASTTTIPVINEIGVNYDKERNLVKVNFDHHLTFNDETSVFIFATYPRNKINIPDSLKNLRSNRFDVRILLSGGNPPDPQLFEFLMNFVFKLKAFHSLLRKIVFKLNILEVYNVTDYCFGQLQVPGAVIPNEDIEAANDCNEDDATSGFKQEDLDLRQSIFSALVEEFGTWKDLDDTRESNSDLEKFLNLPVNDPAGKTCQFTHLGQNRVSLEPDVDLDHNADTRKTLCDDKTPPLPDNCFTGRVNDELDIVPQLPIKEVFRCTPCRLSMGSGFFWLYTSDEFSNQRDGFGSFKGQNGRSFLGRKISKYDNPVPFAPYYTDRPYLIDGQLDGDQLLAYRKPSLEVQKDNLAFPSHRFPTMSKIKEDFTHPTWKAKPWDNENSDLNARLVERSDGDDDLVYDVEDLVYLGNGFDPDISSLGEHEDRSFLVTHKVFLVAAPNHAAITLDDRIELTQETDIALDSTLPFGSIFRSFNSDCNQDFRSGYPAETGRFDVDASEFDFIRENTTELDFVAIAEGLGLPVREGETAVTAGLSALFTAGSQILVTEDQVDYGFYEPFRMDCDCSKFGCGPTGMATASELTQCTDADITLNVETCHIDLFRQPDGSLDFNCDQLTISPTAQLSEFFGACSTRLDGTIPNMLCILENGAIPEGSRILPEGIIRFKDDYGVIYEGSWVFVDNILDIMMTTKSPHVWGEPDTGFVTSDRRVMRRGIVTTIRHIIEVFDDGSYEIKGIGTDQKIDLFQSNVVCGEELFVDNFCFHVDCQVTDELNMLVTCGPRFTFCDDGTIIWPFLVQDSFGIITGIETPDSSAPFHWVDVWGNDEGLFIDGVCITGGTEEPKEISFEGEGGAVPVMEPAVIPVFGAGSWSGIVPEFPFVSEIEINVDKRIIGFVGIDLIGLNHTFSGDLHATLTNPQGSTVTIFHRPGSTAGNFGNFGNFSGDYRFVESSFPLLPDLFDILPGTYRRDPGDWPGTAAVPIGTFDEFIHNSTRGVWRLTIYDWESGDTGSIDSWVLNMLVECD